MTWQPIATAPRDGTIILAYAPSWDDEFSPEAQRIGSVVWRSWGPLSDDFTWFACDCCDGVTTYRHATHWMPLPAPPEPACDTATFLARMLTAAETGTPVTADDVARLRRLADWADAPPPDGWNGTLDKHETRRAVEAARSALP